MKKKKKRQCQSKLITPQTYASSPHTSSLHLLATADGPILGSVLLVHSQNYLKMEIGRGMLAEYCNWLSSHSKNKNMPAEHIQASQVQVTTELAWSSRAR